MLRNFAWAAFAGCFLLATAFIVPVSVVHAAPVTADSDGQA